jgi:VanZ family protein
MQAPMNREKHPMKPALKSRLFKFKHQLVLVVLFAYWSLIAIGTHLPSGDGGGIPFVSDTLVHFGAFSGLGFLLAWSLMRKAPSLRMVVLLIGITLGYAAIDEVTQAWVPTRFPEWNDWVADSIGSCVGLLAYFGILKLLRMRHRAPGKSWTSNSVPVKDAA